MKAICITQLTNHELSRKLFLDVSECAKKSTCKTLKDNQTFLIDSILADIKSSAHKNLTLAHRPPRIILATTQQDAMMPAQEIPASLHKMNWNDVRHITQFYQDGIKTYMGKLWPCIGCWNGAAPNWTNSDAGWNFVDFNSDSVGKIVPRIRFDKEYNWVGGTCTCGDGSSFRVGSRSGGCDTLGCEGGWSEDCGKGMRGEELEAR
jgi:hypothetical protein